jgi:transposase-like protein
MPLSMKLRNAALAFGCPHCGHTLVKSGAWFMGTKRFTCGGCGREVRLTYEAKLALFEAAEALLRMPPPPAPDGGCAAG